MADAQATTRMPMRATIGFVVFAALVLTFGYLYYTDETVQYRRQVGMELDTCAGLKVLLMLALCPRALSLRI